jgi:SAM-dependent methyltransferase
MSRLLKALPAPLRRRIRTGLIRFLDQPTISEGWEQYSQKHEAATDGYLGDEWNTPDIIGVDAPAGEVVSYLDREVFAPFLGNTDVILEIGCGGGRFSEILLPKCSTLIAADTAPTMLKLMKKRFAGNSKIRYVLLDGLGLSPIKDESVDAAFSYGVFVHLQHWDIYNYLSELERVLKPGGKAIIQHANTFSDLGWGKFVHDVKPSLNRHKLVKSFSVMTPEMMAEFVSRTGLTTECCRVDAAKRDGISLIRKPEK